MQITHPHLSSTCDIPIPTSLDLLPWDHPHRALKCVIPLLRAGSLSIGLSWQLPEMTISMAQNYGHTEKMWKQTWKWKSLTPGLLGMQQIVAAAAFRTSSLVSFEGVGKSWTPHQLPSPHTPLISGTGSSRDKFSCKKNIKSGWCRI